MKGEDAVSRARAKEQAPDLKTQERGQFVWDPPKGRNSPRNKMKAKKQLKMRKELQQLQTKKQLKTHRLIIFFSVSCRMKSRTVCSTRNVL